MLRLNRDLQNFNKFIVMLKRQFKFARFTIREYLHSKEGRVLYSEADICGSQQTERQLMADGQTLKQARRFVFRLGMRSAISDQRLLEMVARS